MFTGREKGQSSNQRFKANRRRECENVEVLPHHVSRCLRKFPACNPAVEVAKRYSYNHGHHYLCHPFRVESVHEDDESTTADRNRGDLGLWNWPEPRRWRCRVSWSIERVSGLNSSIHSLKQTRQGHNHSDVRHTTFIPAEQLVLVSALARTHQSYLHALGLRY